MRLGEELEAKELLEKSFEIDPFNVRVKNMLAEWDWAIAGGQDLAAIISEIGALQVEPEVKREMLEDALAASVVRIE